MKKLLLFFSLVLIAVLGSIAPFASAAEIGFTATTSTTPSNPGVSDPTTIHILVKNLQDPVSDAIVDIEIYKDGVKTFQQFFEHQNFGHLESKFYTVNWTPDAPGEYRVKVGVFSAGWGALYFWKNNGSFFAINDGGDAAPMPSRQIGIWWPTDGAIVSGIQTLKALVENMPVADYTMHWRVDGGQPNLMHDSAVDWPHKETVIDLTGWTWNGEGPYTLTFEAKDLSGRVITFRMIDIVVAH